MSTSFGRASKACARIIYPIETMQYGVRKFGMLTDRNTSGDLPMVSPLVVECRATTTVRHVYRRLDYDANADGSCDR